MACSTQTVRVTRPVWTKGDDSATFIAFHRIKLGQWRKVRVSAIIEAASGDGWRCIAKVPGDCNFTDVAENLIRWAMSQRYPASMEPSCCRQGLIASPDDPDAFEIAWPSLPFAPWGAYAVTEAC